MISPFAPIQEQINAFFPPAGHPYRRLNERIMDRLAPDATVLDIGCGRRAPMLREIAPGVGRAIGVDLVEFDIDDPNLEVFNASVAAMPMLEGDTVDLAYSRSVMEHVEDPDAALREVHRVLKPGGAYVFLTPSRHDYASLLASVVPNRWHRPIGTQSHGIGTAVVAKRYGIARRAISSHAQSCWRDPYGIPGLSTFAILTPYGRWQRSDAGEAACYRRKSRRFTIPQSGRRSASKP